MDINLKEIKNDSEISKSVGDAIRHKQHQMDFTNVHGELKTHGLNFLASFSNSNNLHSVCADGNLSLAKALILQRADPNEKDRWGNEPLKFAIIEGHTEIIDFLKRSGASCSRESNNDLECMFCKCAAEGNLQALKKMTAGKVSVEAVDYDRRSALHLAASRGHEDVVEFLLSCGADPTIEDGWAKRPIDHAIHGGHLAVQKILCRADVPLFDGSSQQSAKRARANDDDRTFGRTRSASTGDIFEMTRPQISMSSTISHAARRNSCGPCAGGDVEAAARLATLGEASNTARRLTAKGATLDAHIRWGGDGASLPVPDSLPDVVSSAEITAKIVSTGEVAIPSRLSSDGGPDRGRRRCTFTESSPTHSVAPVSASSSSDLAIEKWDCDSPRAAGNSPSAAGGVPRGPVRCPLTAPAWSGSAGPECFEALCRGRDVVAATSAVADLAEDGHLARMRYIFVHGADVTGPARSGLGSRTAARSSSGKSGCDVPPAEGAKAAAAGEAPRRLARCSSLVALRYFARSRASASPAPGP